MTRLPLAALALSLLAAPVAAETDHTASPRFEEIKVDAGRALFDTACRRCHAPDSTDASYGPPLMNVVGRGAGTYPDYDYSIALEASGIVWTDGALRAWMEDNDGFIPGVKMRHVGIEDRTIQDFILAYLHALSNRDPKDISK